MNLIHFIHVCQGFDKETYFGTTGVCQRIKNNLWQLQNFPENSFYQDCSLSKSRHTRLFSGKFSEMRVMSSDVILIFQNCEVLDLSQSALPSIHSVPLPPLKSSAVLPTVYVLYVCMSVHIHTCTCQVCIKASSIQLMVEKEVPSSCESRRRPTPLYRCEYILFLCKMCINAFTGTQRSRGLFLWCTVLFSWTYLGFSFPSSLSWALWTTRSLLLHTEWRGTNKANGKTHLNLCSVPFCPWTVTEDGLFKKKHGYQVCILPRRTSRILNVCALLFCASPAWSECILKNPAVSHNPENATLSKHRFFKEKC